MLLFKDPVRAPFVPCRTMVSRGFVWEFCYNSRPFAIFNAGSLTLSVDSTTFSFFSFCLYLFIRPLYFLFCFSRSFVSHCYSFPLILVITDCASLVKFLLICVIMPCYVIIFVLLCHPLYCKRTKGNGNLLITCTATNEGH